MNDKTFVLKLGGSMISKDSDKLFDFDFLKEFATIIRKYTKKGYRFVIILGGGYLMRMYRDMAKEAGISQDLDLHWIGTTSNNLNAEVVRAYISEIANDRIVAYEDYYTKDIKFEKSVIVGGGGRAGHSGDADALQMAKRLGIKTIISLKNVDGVYSKDPKKDPNAKRKSKLTWDEYLTIIGNPQNHAPGANFPVDPVTSRLAKELNKEFVIVSGQDLPNFENVLNSNDFLGTTISK